MRMITVTRNNIPTISAAFLSLCLLINILLFPSYGEMSSEVMSKIIAVTASQRLMSQRDRGKYIFTPYFVLEGM
jgi:hypothetical protein